MSSGCPFLYVGKWVPGQGNRRFRRLDFKYWVSPGTSLNLQFQEMSLTWSQDSFKGSVSSLRMF